MTFTRALSTNNYGCAKFIVDGTTTANGTHSTIASALTSASSGDTIFIRPGTYTENLTLKAGVNLTAFGSDSSFNGTGKVIISGTCTMTTAGSVTISGIQLQTNSAFLLAVTGSAASVVNLQNCYLNMTNNTGISHTSSSSSSAINIYDCEGNVGTTGITPFISTSSGTILMKNTRITNSGASSTTSSTSAGAVTLQYTRLFTPITTSSSGTFSLIYSDIECDNQNVTALTLAGTGTSGAQYSIFGAGTASGVSVGAGTTLNFFGFNDVVSSNTNAVTGAGTIVYNAIGYSSTSSVINTTTKTPRYIELGSWRSAGQPAFSAYLSTSPTNVTGDGTAYTVIFDTVVKNQGSNYNNATGVFTAPITGLYAFSVQCDLNNLAVGNTSQFGYFSGTYTFYTVFRVGAASTATSITIGGTAFVQMTASETISFIAQANGAPKAVGIDGGLGSATFSGYLVC